MKIIKRYEEDGYTITEYDTGHIVKEIIGDPITEEPIQPEEMQLSDIETAILDTAVNTEYLVCLAELGI